MNQLSTASITLIVSASFVIVIAGLKIASPIILPFVLAVFIALLMTPMINFFNAKGLPNGLSILLGIMLLIGFGMLIGSLVGNSVTQFIANSESYQQRLDVLFTSAADFFKQFDIDISFELLHEHLNPAAIFPLATNLLNAVGGVLANTFIIVLFLIFILTEDIGLYERLKLAFPEQHESLTTIQTINSKITKYMGIKTAISLATGLTIYIGLLIIGVDYPLLWGFLAFLLNFIPNFGSLIAAVPPILLALLQLGPVHALITTGLYFVSNTLYGNVIEPKVLGDGLGISPIVVLVSLVFWGWIWGPVGMILSVPLTVMIMLVMESSDNTKWVSVLLSSQKIP